VKDGQSLTLADWLRRYGQNPSHLTAARIPRGAWAGFLELHIEPGPNLYETKVPIGVWQGIVGVNRWIASLMGLPITHMQAQFRHRRSDDGSTKPTDPASPQW
jgi:hypothetical protein